MAFPGTWEGAFPATSRGWFLPASMGLAWHHSNFSAILWLTAMCSPKVPGPQSWERSSVLGPASSDVQCHPQEWWLLLGSAIPNSLAFSWLLIKLIPYCSWVPNGRILEMLDDWRPNLSYKNITTTNVYWSNQATGRTRFKRRKSGLHFFFFFLIIIF